MNYFSYKVEHDFGLAPNPFGSYCTLAVCKADIRKNKRLQLGDWIIGSGSAALKNINHLVFAMKVQEKLTFQEYWDDERFQYKKPVINGSLSQMYGDNFYHFDSLKNEWIQEDSAHSLDTGKNEAHAISDTEGSNVLISKHFYYFGDAAFEIPEQFILVCNVGRKTKSISIPKNIADEFITWLEDNYNKGIHGDPINWKSHK